MRRPVNIGLQFTLLLGALLLPAPDAAAQNHASNPYRTVEGVWGQLPEGRTWGSTSAVYPAADGMHMWVGERCGANLCEDSDADPILLFSSEGELVRSFGAGMIVWPHGLHVDSDGNVWVADARGSADGRGHQVHKFSPDGELVMSLGQAGVAGSGEDTFTQPSDVLVAPDGSIFVVDGHGAGNNNRVVKFDSSGKFLLQWGETGKENGEFRDPHALAMDSRGRLFVGDRGNSRIQVFTQDGEHLLTWTQFGRPSGLFIDQNDVLYSADSESTDAGSMSNMGFSRGIRVGSVHDGLITAFIPDPQWRLGVRGTTAAEGVAVDALGNIYGAEVGPRTLRKHLRVR
ncbi:MAG: peptidyl-alpha-hydroxyglycine alpha-amidating lyase family protein [Longimicrobiales bacterium]|jgi:streptogramin lyase